ncbi:MAG: hotdog fold thioesterase [Syntrophomonadaceae bacterium]|nr:hotdog fold thioesterase [Syntrophomonadaceae bacterium]
MEQLFQEFKKDALAELLGVKILEIHPGYAKTSLEVNPGLVNSLGMTHGAAIFALVDMALAAASNSRGKVAVALNVSINYLKATQPGDNLWAIAQEEKLTRRTGVYRIVVEKESGEKVAVATGTAFRTDRTFTGEY